MKVNHLYLVIFFIIALLSFAGCSNNDEEESPSFTDVKTNQMYFDKHIYDMKPRVVYMSHQHLYYISIKPQYTNEWSIFALVDSSLVGSTINLTSPLPNPVENALLLGIDYVSGAPIKNYVGGFDLSISNSGLSGSTNDIKGTYKRYPNESCFTAGTLQITNDGTNLKMELRGFLIDERGANLSTVLPKKDIDVRR